MSLPKPFYLKRILNILWPRSVMIFFALLSGLIFCANTASAQGNLLITPRRVLFEGSKRSMDLNLANTGQDSATYAISLVQIRMKEDGGFETITEPDPGQNFADKNLRFFPRSVALGPGETQSIKVQITRINDLKPGEYRSHFYFRAVPKQTALGEESGVIDSTTISVRITPIFGITIPAIIRIGESNTKTTLSGLSFSNVNDTVPTLSFTFNRTGNMSVYGDLTIDHISLQGKVTRVAVANGIAVYTPNTIRRLQLNLKKLPEVDYNKGKLRVIYSAPSDVKPLRYAEAELVLLQ